MNELATIRLELGINAQRHIQQIQLVHGAIEEQIALGIEKALNDLCQGDNFVELVRESTKVELKSIVHKTVFAWETRAAIEKAIADKIGEKVNDFANKIADDLISNIKNVKI